MKGPDSKYMTKKELKNYVTYKSDISSLLPLLTLRNNQVIFLTFEWPLNGWEDL